LGLNYANIGEKIKMPNLKKVYQIALTKIIANCSFCWFNWNL